MHLRAPAIILAVRAHGEHGAIVRGFTRDDGVQPGYVRGGRSRRLRPVLLPANTVLGEWRARTGEQLAALTVELVHSRAARHAEPLPAAALEWVTALTATALPEAQAYPRLHDGLAGVLDAIEAAPTARGWAAALVRYELLLLAELGFGLDLERCVATGAQDELAFVSPKSGGAVSRAAAIGLEAKLLPLPDFARAGGEADWPAIFDGLRLTGHFLARDILVDRRADTLAARERLVERLKRAVA
ncbi:MAG: repair protein RecO [Sphingomonas bacterium]|uniref:DNA repair protein RecO n=1 Tax=Sphingomonas bacterium TaxID=1895847 RepID=UPI002627975F|nr:DNA repair protein RecO [Sphingomonas bacterium]MDB5695869.1 repair protein RecO [Sphingomonas bacterium]